MRLIDADAFEVISLQGKSEEFCNGVMWMLEQLDKAPTIPTGRNMTEVEKYFLDKCEKKVTNRMCVTDTPWRFRHPDHYNMAKKAYEEGRKYYYYEPVNPNNPYGELRECEPKYVYECHIKLTVEEYEELKNKCR